MCWQGLKVQEAANEVINHQIKPAGGDGGVIVLDPKGNVASAYDSEGMFRGYITDDGQITTILFEK